MENQPTKQPNRAARRTPGGHTNARHTAFAGVVLLVALAVCIALLSSDDLAEPETGDAIRRQRSAARGAADGASLPLRRGGANTEASRRAAVQLPQRITAERRATPPGVGAVESPGEENEVVIVNEPGREFPRGIDAAEYIQGLRDMGETEGIAAFPPPGTDPPKAGVVVPQDYDLPEGYERYFQYTDDGKQLEPILRFSPEYEFFDDSGNPIPIPEDRIVPIEQAPAGLPAELLDLERPRDSEQLVGETP